MTKTMTTIINIETSTYQLPLSFRWVLVLLCLVVLASGCRSAVTTQASVALNTYQTAQTMPSGGFGFRVIGPSFASSIGAMTQYYKDFSIVNSTMYVGGLDFQFGLGTGWDIGLITRADFNFIDGSLSARPYAKVRFTENAAPFIGSILFGGEIVAGSASNDRQVYRGLFGQLEPLSIDSSRPNISASLSSSTYRIFVSVPMNFAISTNDDVIIHPGLHYLEQHIVGGESYYYADTTSSIGPYPQTILRSIQRDAINRYLIPSLGISIRGRTNEFFIQPELTLALAGENVLWNIGISFQFGKFGE